MAKVRVEGVEIIKRQNKEPENQLKVGKIDYFEKFTGNGLILQKDDTKISFHSSRTTYSVKEGDIVTYQLELGPRGWHAVDVTRK